MLQCNALSIQAGISRRTDLAISVCKPCKILETTALGLPGMEFAYNVSTRHDPNVTCISFEPKKGRTWFPACPFWQVYFLGGNIMKSSTKDKIKGLADKIKGNVKEGIGSISDNRDLEEDGKKDQLKGAAREKVGEIKKVFNQ
jgi:uncharacterized protein YjbJ (UPF0337 family)